MQPSDRNGKREILRSALMEKFKKAYGKDEVKHREIIEFIINEFFVKTDKVPNLIAKLQLNEHSLKELKSRVEDAISKKSSKRPFSS